jgi:hypothetical protein
MAWQAAQYLARKFNTVREFSEFKELFTLISHFSLRYKSEHLGPSIKNILN